ncbi:MAG: DUF4388 domain-containing protein [Chloroflexota bacterium]|nr:DUF4388 domain-containing protein [Chloroflexota bacterium]
MTSRYTSTTRLSNVIEMVKLSKQNGVLRVTRSQPQRELGQIRFISGEPVSALLGSLTGGTALSALSNWGECLYEFEEGAPESEQSYPSLPNTSQPQSPAYSPSSPPPPSLGSWPSYGYPSTNSLNSLSPLPDFGSSGDGSMPGYYGTGQPSQSGYGYPAPDPYGGGGYPGASSSATTSTTLPPLRPEQLMSRPRRTSLSEQVDQLPLDRRERMVLLLVDGQRTVADLVRLTRRSDSELYSVLNHLRILGLVLL